MTPPRTLDAPEVERPLLLAGYLAAGEPRTLVPILIKPTSWPDRRRIVLQMNGRHLDERHLTEH